MTDNGKYIGLLRELLSDYRFAHSLNVADSARRLACRYGGDAETAYTAGLLHDIMKDTEPTAQLAVIGAAGMSLTPVELRSPKLWHAVAGAAYIKTELKLDDDELINSVRYHTTGRADMSLNEKIVFIADYISDERSYDGVDKMRRLAESGLEPAMLFGLEFTISSLIKKSKFVHPDSVACYNELIMNLKGNE